MRVLFVSHTGAIGGGEISMLELIRHLPGDVEAAAAVPAGPLNDELRGLGVPVREIPPLVAGLRVSPVSAATSAADLRRGVREVARATRAVGADVVHANSVRAALLVRQAPLVAFVRDALPSTFVARGVQRSVARRASGVVANSRFTADAFAAATGRRPGIVYPPIDVERFSAPRPAAAARRRLGIGDEAGHVVGVVAQLTPWKGQSDAVEALALVRRRLPGVRLLLIGEAKFRDPRTRFDNVAYESALRDAVTRSDLTGAVHFLGERSDLPDVFASLDVLLAPSWEEPFGRSVAEAMAAGIPVIATDRGGTAEQIVHGRSGLLVPPRDPALLANAIVSLLADDDRRDRIALAARMSVRRFDVAEHVELVIRTYSDAIHTPTERAA